MNQGKTHNNISKKEIQFCRFQESRENAGATIEKRAVEVKQLT